MDAPSSYSHRFHAGNVADVWKHVAMLAVLEASVEDERRIVWLDTHAGEGGYRLGSTGEWTEGVGRLWRADRRSFEATPIVSRYLERVAKLGGGPARGYPGSPLLALAALRGGDRAVFCERADDAVQVLRKRIGSDRRATVVAGDGYGSLESVDPGDALPIVFVDPPFVAREEWAQAPDAVARVITRLPGARCLLWYPVKSLTRPNALHARLRDAKVPAVAIDLVVTPLELKRNALAGSGVLLVNPPAQAIPVISAAAASLGPVCATHDGRWSVRTTAWGS